MPCAVGLFTRTRPERSAMAKVAIDEATGQVLCFYNETVLAEDNEGVPATHGTPPSMEGIEGVRVVDKPDWTRREIEEDADRKAGGRAGRMWLSKDGEIEAEPPDEEPADLLEELQQARPSKKADEPLTWADLDAASEKRVERERKKPGRGRG